MVTDAGAVQATPTQQRHMWGIYQTDVVSWPGLMATRGLAYGGCTSFHYHEGCSQLLKVVSGVVLVDVLSKEGVWRTVVSPEFPDVIGKALLIPAGVVHRLCFPVPAVFTETYKWDAGTEYNIHRLDGGSHECPKIQKFIVFQNTSPSCFGAVTQTEGSGPVRQWGLVRCENEPPADAGRQGTVAQGPTG